MNLLGKFRDWASRLSEHGLRPIRITPSGFESGKSVVSWSAVTKIAAFKKDLVTFDDIWFVFSAGQDKVLVCEEQPGFAELLAEVKARFPSVEGWEQQVVQPAFAESYTVLYVGP